MKQVFILFKTDAEGKKEIKGIYLERHKAVGENVYNILKDNQESDSKVVYSYEPQNVYQPAAKAKKAKASSNGRTPVTKTFDTAKA